jgi:hypothetical protein
VRAEAPSESTYFSAAALLAEAKSSGDVVDRATPSASRPPSLREKKQAAAFEVPHRTRSHRSDASHEQRDDQSVKGRELREDSTRSRGRKNRQRSSSRGRSSRSLCGTRSEERSLDNDARSRASSRSRAPSRHSERRSRHRERDAGSASAAGASLKSPRDSQLGDSFRSKLSAASTVSFSTVSFSDSLHCLQPSSRSRGPAASPLSRSASSGAFASPLPGRSGNLKEVWRMERGPSDSVSESVSGVPSRRGRRWIGSDEDWHGKTSDNLMPVAYADANGNVRIAVVPLVVADNYM